MKFLLHPLVVFLIVSNVFARDFLPPIQIVTLTAADASTQECYLFQTTAGVKYTVQYSNDLTTWTNGGEIYGLGFEYAVAMRQLAAAPPPDSNGGSGTEPPPPLSAPSVNVSLCLQPSSDASGGTVVSWPSLDDGSPVIASTTVSLDSAWAEIPLYRYAKDMAKDGTAIGDSHANLQAPIHINGKWTSIEKAAPDITAAWKNETVQLLDTTANGWILAKRNETTNTGERLENAVLLPLRMIESPPDLAFLEATGVDAYSINSEDPMEITKYEIYKCINFALVLFKYFCGTKSSVVS